MPVLRTYDVTDIEKIVKIQEEAQEKRKNNIKAEYTPEEFVKSPDLDIYNEYVLQQQQANKM